MVASKLTPRHYYRTSFLFRERLLVFNPQQKIEQMKFFYKKASHLSGSTMNTKAKYFIQFRIVHFLQTARISSTLFYRNKEVKKKKAMLLHNI